MVALTLAGAFRTRSVAVLTALCVVSVLVVALRPQAAVQGTGAMPASLVDDVHRHWAAHFARPAIVALGASGPFFIPVGFLLAPLTPPRSRWLAVLRSAPLSGAVEHSQGEFLPRRSFDASEAAADRQRHALLISDVRAARRGADRAATRA